MVASGCAMCHADISTRSAFANVSMVVANVIVDLVNVEPYGSREPS